MLTLLFLLDCFDPVYGTGQSHSAHAIDIAAEYEQIGWFIFLTDSFSYNLLIISSFVPAESATLGIVDKSTLAALSYNLGTSLTSTQSLLAFRQKSLSLKYLLFSWDCHSPRMDY